MNNALSWAAEKKVLLIGDDGFKTEILHSVNSSQADTML
jgi:hypothetical protein